MGDLGRQHNLEWVLVHALVLLATMEVRKSVLDIYECLGEACSVAELRSLREVATAETDQIERDIDSLEVLLKIDLQTTA